MANYFGIYQSNPTSGLTDGTPLSSGDGSSPLTFSLNATNNEISNSTKLAIRMIPNYASQGNMIIQPSGTNSNKWQLSLDNITWANYGSAITISGQVTAVNTIFYARCKSVSTEEPQNDIGVDIQASCTVIYV